MTLMTEPASRRAVFNAAWEQGFDPATAELIAHGFNHVYRLPRAGVIAKVHQPGTSAEAAHRQNRIALWLLRNGIPAPRPAGHTTQPATADPLLVTFADDLGTGPAANPHQLATLLRSLHSLEVPNDLDLPAMDPFPELARRITALAPTAVNGEQRMRLRVLFDEARERWAAAAWPEHRCVVHGDVGWANTITTAAGPALLDFERVAVGYAWQDLAAVAWDRDAFGGNSADYAEFAAAYGVDVVRHDRGRTYQAITRLSALTGCVTALEVSGALPRWQEEAALRLETVLAVPSPRLPWSWRMSSTLAVEATR
ncbi:phosphotransferase [Kitasatospora sp. NPDC048545]|uniref:phosphotransferase n=1 Tax=Kitasatospora sp. NPDC048545 TaxID=3157208 RepID=UPI0033CDA7AA